MSENLPAGRVLASIIHAYRTDEDSPFKKLRYHSRQNYGSMLDRLELDHGFEAIAEIKARVVLRWHEDWIGPDNHVAMAHGLIGMLRTVVGFGATMMEDEDCAKLSAVLSSMRFKMPKPRSERLTAQQAIAIIETAHGMGLHSVAFAQAIQFDLMFRQKDVIGEWVPESELGQSDVRDGQGHKWLRGVRWNEIDTSLILRHVTSKRGKLIEVDLKLAPLVMAEFTRILESGVTPAPGPMIVSETDGLPYINYQFRRLWRMVADKAGVPKHIKNMDSRAGAISEATDAGADIEKVRHAATHSNSSMTQRYSRGSAEKTAEVMELRAKHRARQMAARDEEAA